MSAAFRVALAVALAVTLAFLALPVIAIFVAVSPGDLISSLSDPTATDALKLSLQTTTAAVVIIVLVGTPAAYFLATREFRGKAIHLHRHTAKPGDAAYMFRHPGRHEAFDISGAFRHASSVGFNGHGHGQPQQIVGAADKAAADGRGL